MVWGCSLYGFYLLCRTGLFLKRADWDMNYPEFIIETHFVTWVILFIFTLNLVC